MGITYVGGQVGGRAGSTSTTNITFALSGGIATTPRPGDLVVIGVTVASQGRTPACAISGYTAGTQQNANGTTYDTSLNLSWKFMGLTPDTTFTLPSTGNTADAQRYTVQVWRGVDPTNPFDVADVVATGAGTGRPNPGSITPTTSGAVVGIIGAGAAATGAAYTAPANYTTNFLTGSTADTNDAMIGSGYRSWTSGAEDPAAYTGGTTNAADSWAAFTYALRPEVSYLPTLISSTAITLGQVASPGAQSITVPADAQVVVVHFACYSASACALSLASDFAGAFTIEQDSTLDECGGVAFAVISSTGSKTITPSWSSAPSEGPIFTVSFIKDVDTAASFVRDTEILVYDTSGAAASVALASRDVDLVLALDKHYDTGEAIPSNPSGWTSILTQGNWDEGARLRSLDSPSDGVNTITSQSTNFSSILTISLRGVEGSGGTPKTLTASLSAAIQAARTATASVSAAIRDSRTASASASGVVVNQNSVSASGSGAIRAAASVAASVAGAIRQDKTVAASASAAVQRNLSATASLAAVVVTQRSATASVSGSIRESRIANTSLSAAVQQAKTATASANAAIRQAKTATALVNGAIQLARTASAQLAGYIQAATGNTATADVSGAIQAPRSATASLSAYISVGAPQQVIASLSAAISVARSASASLSAAISQAKTAQASVSGAIRYGRTTQASLAGVIAQARTATASASATIQAGRVAQTSLTGAILEGKVAQASLSAMIQASITITAEQMMMIADVWQRLGLNPSAPLTETETAAIAGALTIAKSGAPLVSERSGESAPGDLTAMLLDIWQRLGLDPGNPMTATETAVSAGGVAQTIAPVTGGVLVTRT